MSDKAFLKVLYLLVFFYSIYDLLNSASTGNSNENRRSVYVLLFAIVIVLLLYCILTRFVSFFRVFTALFLLSLYCLVDTMFIKGDYSWGSVVYAGLSFWWIFTIWFFYYIVSRKIINFKSIQNFIRVMFVVFSLGVAYGAVNITLNSASINYARVGFIYHILAMLPLVFLERNKKVKNVFLIISICLTIFSFKRGAIILLPVMLLAYLFLEKDKTNRKKNLIRTAFILFFLIIAWLVVDKYSGGYLSSRFTKSELMDGSGRTKIWEITINNVKLRSPLQFILGISNKDESFISAGVHNEYLSFLNSNGLIGFILYLYVLLCLVLHSIVLIKRKSVLAASYTALTIYIIGISFVSGFFHVHSTFYIMVYLGCVHAFDKYDDKTVNLALGR